MAALVAAIRGGTNLAQGAEPTHAKSPAGENVPPPMAGTVAGHDDIVCRAPAILGTRVETH